METGPHLQAMENTTLPTSAASETLNRALLWEPEDSPAPPKRPSPEQGRIQGAKRGTP